MRIAITGSSGQLGRALMARLPVGHEVLGLTRAHLDITDLEAALAVLADFQPEVVIHAAAHTNVDECEAEPETAYRVNALGTRNLAVGAARCGAALVYVSTNYVFDGEAAASYHEWAPTNPVSVYGASKLAGESAARELTGGRFYIVRTAWVYDETGRNFVNTMLRLAATQSELRVVADQYGQPTYAADLAAAIAALIQRPAYGVYHLTNAGVCTWHDWAVETLRLAGRAETPVHPIPAAAYRRPARPPAYGALTNWNGAAIGITLRPWQEALADCLHRRKNDAQ
ncbi:MAG: dTDP-4-dehydrorhamnose reductase [Chloroflexi bacterium]|nr:dTDP-4-dehydrorhamnose reductase [Chloroflexota bacterium]